MNTPARRFITAATVVLIPLSAIVTILAMPRGAAAAVVIIKDSADFPYKYEFNVDNQTPDVTDLDGNGVNDFTSYASGAGSVSGGNLTMTMPLSSTAYYQSSLANQAWDVLAPTLATGYTVEFRLKVISDLSTTGRGGAFNVCASPAGTDANAWFTVRDDGEYWGYTTSNTNLGNEVNTDDFHVFRLAQEAGSATYSVWRDGKLLSSTLTSGYTNSWDLIWLGDPAGEYGGQVQIDYFRFTAGAFAAVPEPSTAVLLLSLAGSALPLVCRGRRRTGRR